MSAHSSKILTTQVKLHISLMAWLTGFAL